MPISKEIDREAIRLLAIEHGVREAARMTGLNEDTVCQWSRRFDWFPTSPRSNEVRAVSSVSKPGDVHLAELQRLERETRMSLARSAANMSNEAQTAKLKDANNALNVGKLAGIVHKWGDEKQNVSFSLNVLNLNMLADTEE